MGAMKKAALIGGGALALGAGGHAGAKLLRKKKLRVGTPLSRSQVVNHTPIKTRQAAGRVVEMSARLDAVLREFAAIDTEEVPYDYGDSYPSAGNRKPSFPCLYLNRSKDKGLMKMAGEGQAVVNYKVKSRNVSEDTEDGVPLYGANIEIRSIEPMEGGGTELGETLFLREFAVKPRSVTKLLKTSKLNPLKIRKDAALGEFRVMPKKAAVKDTVGYYTNDIKDARGTAADMLRRKRGGQEMGFSEAAGLREFGSAGPQRLQRVGNAMMKKLKTAGADTGKVNRAMRPVWVKQDGRFEEKLLKRIKRNDGLMPVGPLSKKDLSSTLFLREFAAPRDRDGEGRFAAGNIPGADDYAIAAASRKKKVAVVGGGTALAGAAMAGLPGGRKLGAGLARGAMRAIGR